MWYDVLTKPKQGKVFCKDRAVLINCLIDYEDSGDWKDIGMISVVTKPGGVPCPKTEKKSANLLQQKLCFCKTSPQECVGSTEKW